MDPEEPPLPTFLIIGAQKSATRWLRLNLGLHPGVFTASTEIAFFNNGDRFETLGLAWYRAQFEGWAGQPIVGEATPGYMFWRHGPACVADRIRSSIPEARLVALLRNPVDRAQSAMIHHIEGGKIPPETHLLELVRSAPPEREPLGIVTGGWYAASLQPYVDRFGDRLVVCLHDDLEDDPRRVYDTVLKHIGAAADFVPPELERVRFSYRQRPSSDPNRRQLSAEERRELYGFFAEDIDRLAALINRDLSLWNPDDRD